jgi:hypothetical protein
VPEIGNCAFLLILDLEEKKLTFRKNYNSSISINNVIIPRVSIVASGD